ncbi:MAG: hypothetical protein OJF51_005106 [Nitrospira sp.]|nr:MAG: hypothetical protein OJF51_005106 [Nitrospira sp.]
MRRPPEISVVHGDRRLTISIEKKLGLTPQIEASTPTYKRNLLLF